MDDSFQPKPDPNRIRWSVRDSILGLESASGDFDVLPAEQIYRMAIEGESNRDLPALSTDGIAGLNGFSRYPLATELRIQGDAAAPPPCLSIQIFAAEDNISVPVRYSGIYTPDHLVADAVWHPLPKGAIEEITSVFEQAGISGPGALSLRQYLTLLQLKATHPLIHDLSGSVASANRQFPEGTESSPPGFAGTLFRYQLHGWRWLKLIATQDLGGILADEMGLGKTVQAIAVLATENAAQRRPSLIVAPGTLLENWRRELHKFTPTLSVVVHHGADRTGFPATLKQSDVAVVSYETLVRDESLFRQIEWNIMVVDEAQAIKNRATQRAMAIKRIPRRVGIAVTGTPLENHVADLWSIVDFALPGLLGDYSVFERSFPNDMQGARTLEPLVSPILLRRRVADVAKDLPTRIDIPQPLELPPVQAHAYEAIRSSIESEYGKSATLVALTRLRMYCAHPWLVEPRTGDPRSASTKYTRLTEIIEEIRDANEKALIFTSFNAMTDLLVRDLGSRFNVPTAFIDGRIAIPERQSVIDEFSRIDGTALLVLNPRAAGVGLNMTSANHVIHYNLEWNPAVEDQASARAHRRGQTRPVTVHRLFYINTVEEIIDQRLTRKRLLSGTAIVGTDGSDDNTADIWAALRRSPVTA